MEFRSSKFPPDGEVNPGRFGKRLADFLSQQLPHWEVRSGPPYPEDWGWDVPVLDMGFSVWVGCGNIDGASDAFLCFVEPHKRTVRKFLRTLDTTAAVSRVVSALENVLSADPQIHEVRWREASNDVERAP